MFLKFYYSGHHNCGDCGKSFEHWGDYKTHLKNNSDSKCMIENVLTTYTCDFCASTYNDVIDLKSHNEAYPMGECTAQSVDNDESLDLEGN